MGPLGRGGDHQVPTDDLVAGDLRPHQMIVDSWEGLAARQAQSVARARGTERLDAVGGAVFVH
jgi:hypothetical protein